MLLNTFAGNKAWVKRSDYRTFGLSNLRTIDTEPQKVQTFGIRQRSKPATQLRGVGGRWHHRVNVSALLGVRQIHVQHTDRCLVTLQLGRLCQEHGRPDRLPRNVPYPHVHVTPVLTERVETYVQRLFRLVAVAGDSVRFDNDRRLVCVGGGFDDRYEIAGNVNVLTLTIQYLQTMQI